MTDNNSGATYFGRILKVDHGWIVDALAGSRLGGMDQITQSGSHVFDGIDQHNLKQSPIDETDGHTRVHLGNNVTCASGLLDPKEAAPNLTTSDN